MEPEQSTMITCAMSAEDTGAADTPLADTVTIASTSRAPSGRYSFWKTSTANSAVTATPHFDDDHGDVVVPARPQGGGGQLARDPQRRRAAGADRVEVLDLGQVVPQAVAAQQHD